MPKITECKDCKLRTLQQFRKFSTSELKFVSGFKSGELVVEAGSTVLLEGTNSPHIFTVLSGWGFREKTLEDGRRQILKFVMPGDLIGLQTALFAEMEHSVQSLTEMTLCVFRRRDVRHLFHAQPDLAFTVVWHAAHEERMLDDHLLSIGRRTAIERIAYILVTLFARARRLGMVDKQNTVAVPITQQHLADALGLSLVHTNKTLRRLLAMSAVTWQAGRLQIDDEARLREIANYATIETEILPLI